MERNIKSMGGLRNMYWVSNFNRLFIGEMPVALAGEVWSKLPDKQAYDKEYARIWDEATTTIWHC